VLNAKDTNVVLEGAKAWGIPAPDLLQNRRTEALLTLDREAGRLPAELRARLLKGEYGAWARIEAGLPFGA
jgi:hypothetical protein